MGKFMKPGKVGLVLAGRYSRPKAVIVKDDDHATSDRPYSHALVPGIDRYPQKVTAAMGKKKITKRSKIMSFVKVYNSNHLMPTRNSADIPLDKTVVNKDVFRDTALKHEPRHKALPGRLPSSSMRLDRFTQRISIAAASTRAGGGGQSILKCPPTSSVYTA
ncbi:hypothetical protein ACRRTK_014919 [Alexandromys fortis]